MWLIDAPLELVVWAVPRGSFNKKFKNPTIVLCYLENGNCENLRMPWGLIDWSLSV